MELRIATLSSINIHFPHQLSENCVIQVNTTIGTDYLIFQVSNIH